MKTVVSPAKKTAKTIAFYLVATVLVGVWLLPLLIGVFTSLKSMDEIMNNPIMWRPPKVLRFDNFVAAWNKAGMGRYIINTFVVTVPSVVGALLVSSLAAFALAFYRFRLNKAVLVLFVAGMLIPFQMLMIPVFRMSNSLGIDDTYGGLILFHIAFQLGFCTFFLRNFMKQIPYSQIEAPRIDGASDFLIYRKIVLPLSLPSLAALGVLEFTWIWNDLLWSLVLLRTDAIKTVTLGLANMQGEFISTYNLTAAGSIIAAAAPLLVFLFFQRYFIEGLTMGADKG
jgi:multiple sugar transport system permease protein